MTSDRSSGYKTVARVLHWLTVIAVAVMIPVGMAMTNGAFEPIQDPLYILHKNLGVGVFLLLSFRIIWRLTHRPDPLPDHLSPLQKRLAAATHFLLYALLVVMVVSGYVRTVGGGFPIEVLNAAGVPGFVPFMPDVAEMISAVHKFAAYLLLAVIAAHVTAALQHLLIHRDGVFARMWPPVAPDRR